VISKLNAEFNAILRIPEMKETLARQGLATTGGSAEDLARLTARDLERWARVVREARIEAE
jgi:tripartite-type tricarboxylate transporter receptor subunit TctC